MRATLAAEVESFLRVHGAKTASEIAMGIRARRDDVDEVLASEKFTRVPIPEGRSPRATYFSLSYLVPVAKKRTLNRADLMLSVLRDGKPHSRDEIFQSVGFMLTNNAASELRDRGYTVEHSVERGNHIYQLIGGLDEAAATDPPAAASSNPNEPEAA